MEKRKADIGKSGLLVSAEIDSEHQVEHAPLSVSRQTPETAEDWCVLTDLVRTIRSAKAAWRPPAATERDWAKALRETVL